MDTPVVTLKKCDYMFTGLQISCDDVMANGVWRWDLEMGVSCYKKIGKLGIGDDVCLAIAFGYPLCNVGADAYSMSKRKVLITQVSYSPKLNAQVCTMRICNGSLALTGKGTENVSTSPTTRLLIYGLVDCVLPEAVHVHTLVNFLSVLLRK